MEQVSWLYGLQEWRELQVSGKIITDYKIITDATADFCPSLLQGLPRVEIIPMTVTMDDVQYLYGPGGNLTTDRFYAMQRDGKFASTTQINPETYRKAFETALQGGYDVLYFGFSSGMSGCVNNARLCMDELRAEYPQRKLYCIDSLSASVGEAFLIHEAALRQYNGMPIEELAAWLDSHKLHVCHWFTVDTFDHLKHGGRVSGTAAAVGSVLNIKPMLHVDELGKLAVTRKPRGRRRAIREMIAQMQAGWTPDISPLVIIGHSDDPSGAAMLHEAILVNSPEADIHTVEIGPVIGAHTGPGMLAVIYWGSNR